MAYWDDWAPMTAIAGSEFAKTSGINRHICFRYVNFYAGKAVAKVCAAYLDGWLLPMATT